MIAIAEQPATVKPRKRQAAKPPSRAATEKHKLTLYVSSEAARRLAVHATMTGTDRSSLVESLIREQLRRFVVSDRDRGTAPADSSLMVSESAEA